MIKIKVNGMPRQIPENWDEVTFKMFLGLIEAKDDTSKVIPVLLDMSPEDIRGKKIEGLDWVLEKVSFLKKVPAIDEIPVKLGDFTFPKDVGFETIEQFENTKTEINRTATAKNLVEQTKALALYAAIYLQGAKETYDFEKAKALAEKFLDYPCLEVMAAGSFFQAKCLQLTSGLSMTYLRRNTLLKKKRPGLNRLMRRLASMLHLTVLPGMWAKLTKKSSNGPLTSSTPS